MQQEVLGARFCLFLSLNLFQPKTIANMILFKQRNQMKDFTSQCFDRWGPFCACAFAFHAALLHFCWRMSFCQQAGLSLQRIYCSISLVQCARTGTHGIHLYVCIHRVMCISGACRSMCGHAHGDTCNDNTCACMPQHALGCVHMMYVCISIIVYPLRASISPSFFLPHQHPQSERPQPDSGDARSVLVIGRYSAVAATVCLVSGLACANALH